tara:strand:+ start:239 stop:1159 length:921 start_codon:yes stop_codon:yes gene_type:complete
MNDKIQIIEKIIHLRFCQILVNERYKNGEFKIPIHLAFGHESLAVAVDGILQENDSLFLTHRNIHYNFARMETLIEELNEYYLKNNGLAGGRLGSMNLSNPQKNIPYSSSILGNNLPVATGFALGNKLNKKNGIVIVVTGDGAIEEGAFYETIVFMKSNNLSVIVIVENNEWSLGTKIEERRCEVKLDQIADSVGIDHISLSGNDPFQYIRELERCRSQSIENKQPVILEVELTTLGYWYMETQEFPTGKFINYHAGPAPEVEIVRYPQIANSAEDPLYILKEHLTEKELKSISTKILNKLKSELA